MSGAKWFINSNDQYLCIALIKTITANQPVLVFFRLFHLELRFTHPDFVVLFIKRIIATHSAKPGSSRRFLKMFKQCIASQQTIFVNYNYNIKYKCTEIIFQLKDHRFTWLIRVCSESATERVVELP